jgi:hypothetical protein
LFILTVRTVERPPFALTEKELNMRANYEDCAKLAAAEAEAVAKAKILTGDRFVSYENKAAALGVAEGLRQARELLGGVAETEKAVYELVTGKQP